MAKLPSLDSVRPGVFILARLLSTDTLHPTNPHGFKRGRIYKFNKGASMYFIYYKGEPVDLVFERDIHLIRVLK
jgi:hypothetical protein